MIPQDAIAHWRTVAPWAHDPQVEQDLILSRALVEIFQEPALSGALLLRGGTALHKLCLAPAARYSEDIDLVQAKEGAIGDVIDALRSRLDPFLGRPHRDRKSKNVILQYRFESEIPPVVPLRLQVEINSREHFTVFGAVSLPYRVASPWFTGEAQVGTYALEELLATKLRALYQRKKGRDLFDLHLGLRTAGVRPDRILEAFHVYMDREGSRVSSLEFEGNLDEKLSSGVFGDDIRPLLRPDLHYDPKAAAAQVREALIRRL